MMNTNITADPVAQLGGRIWPLKINHNVLQRFSAIAHVQLFQIESTLSQYHMMVLMLWLMLCETDPKLKREELDGWLNDMPVLEAMNFVAENVGMAMIAAFPRDEKQDDAEAGEESADQTADPT